MNKKKVQSKELSQDERLQSFQEEYRDLCIKYNLQMVVIPAFKARDDGSWSIVQQVSLGELPKESSESK